MPVTAEVAVPPAQQALRVWQVLQVKMVLQAHKALPDQPALPDNKVSKA
jgi:hypothetical protein